MRLPIRIRVALYVTFTYAVVITALSFVLVEVYEKYSYRSIDVTLQAAASSVANRLVKENIQADVSGVSEDIGETISNFENRIGVVKVGIFDASWREVFSYNDGDSITSDSKPGNRMGLKDRDEFITIKSHGREFRCAFANFEVADSLQGTVVALGSLSSTRESIDRIRAIIFIIAPLTILLVGIGSVLIARQALRPLEKVAFSIDGIRVDKPLEKIEVPQVSDEIKKVAESFNALIQRIGKLIETQRNFLLDASHELKTPLTVIQTEIEMLLMNPGSTAEERENLQQLLSEVEYASKLAIDLIYLSNLESSRPAEMRPVDLGAVLEEVVDHYRVIAGKKNINFRFKHEANLRVMGDSNLIRRALSNVIDNAIKYSRVGGEAQVTGKLDEKSSNAIVFIEDKGEGISREELPRVFDRFYRTKSSRGGDEKGSGLGLSIAKRIVEQHNGVIIIESEPNVGTTVKIELPAVL
jgi:signal transduction histidine kinase